MAVRLGVSGGDAAEGRGGDALHFFAAGLEVGAHLAGQRGHPTEVQPAPNLPEAREGEDQFLAGARTRQGKGYGGDKRGDRTRSKWGARPAQSWR